jgi:hypothetical protein
MGLPAPGQLRTGEALVVIEKYSGAGVIGVTLGNQLRATIAGKWAGGRITAAPKTGKI